MLFLFKSLETENLKLIQECQKAQEKLEACKVVSIRTRSELNQQAENLETEINQLEEKIKKEKRESAKIEEVIESAGRFLHILRALSKRHLHLNEC